MSAMPFYRFASSFLFGVLAGFAPVLASLSAAEAPTIMVVTNSVALKKGAILNMRLVVRGSNLTIEGEGATLQGTGVADDLKSLETAGIGVLLEGCVNVTVRNLKARGFSTGLLAREGRALLIEGCDFSENYHNPKHGWGELPPRGGLLLDHVRQSVVRNTKANRVWDGLDLVESDENLVEDNDISRCS